MYVCANENTCSIASAHTVLAPKAAALLWGPAAVVDNMLLSPASLKDITVCRQRTQLWLYQRRLRFTATEAAKLLRQSKYGNPASVLADKRGTAEGNAPTQAQQYGIDNEGAAVSVFLKNNRDLVRECEETGLWVSPTDPWLCASPDRILTLHDGTKALLGVKCFARKPEEKIPDDIYLQVGYWRDSNACLSRALLFMLCSLLGVCSSHCRVKQLTVLMHTGTVSVLCRSALSWLSALHVGCLRGPRHQHTYAW